MAEVAANLVVRVIPRIEMRQWVLSVPYRYRYRLARNGKRMRQVLGIFLRAVFGCYRKRAKERGLKRPRFGAVSFPQRFGSSLNLHVHWHALVADGVFVAGEDGAPTFRFVGEPSDAEVEEVTRVVAQRVGRLARRLGWDEIEDEADDVWSRAMAASLQSPLAFGSPAELAPQPVRSPRCAQVEEYSVHANVALASWDRRGLEKLIRYMARPPLAVDRLSVDGQGRVVYRFKKRRKDGAEVLVLDPLDFLSRLTGLIPPKGAHALTYHGIFGAAAKERAAIVPAGKAERRACPQPSAGAESGETPAQSAERQEAGEKRARRRLRWAELLERCFGVDVSVCGRCGGKLRLISLIEERGAAEKILKHLGLSTTSPPLAPARPPAQAEFDGFDAPWADEA